MLWEQIRKSVVIRSELEKDKRKAEKTQKLSWKSSQKSQLKSKERTRSHQKASNDFKSTTKAASFKPLSPSLCYGFKMWKYFFFGVKSTEKKF